METVAVLGRALPTVTGSRRAPSLRAGVLALALLAGAAASITTPRVASEVGLLRVVVRALPGGADEAARAVQAAGGQVVRVLSTLDEVVGALPGGSLDALRGAAGVAEVTTDAPLHLLASSYDAGADVGSSFNTTRITGAQE
jgi:outer membrane murein-binding lipoprotein Lpp